MDPRISSLSAILLLSGCGLGLSSYAVDDTAVVDGDDDDGGGAVGGGGGGNGGGGSDTGIGNGGGSGAGGGSGSGDAIAVSSITPDYGTTAGGTVVDITGGPFSSGDAVYFGSAEADIISTGDSVLTVRTPSVAEEGMYPVTVRGAAGEGSLETGFVYWQDGAGLDGTLGVVQFTEQVGSYWSDAGGTTYGSATMYFVAPTAVEWWELFAPSLDTCRNEASYTFGGSVSIYDPGVSSVQLTGSRSFSLYWDAVDGNYSVDTLSTSEWAANASYDLQPMTGGGFPEVAVGSMVTTPATPTLYTPAITGSSVVGMSPNPTFSWAATGSDWILITLGMWPSAGTGYQEVVHCVVRDDGSFRVDTGQFSQWPYDRQIDVYFGVARKASGTLPWNGSQSGMVGLNRIYGAARTTY